MVLTGEGVTRIFTDCLFTEDEMKDGNPTNFVEAYGVMTRVGFHPQRLESHREEIRAMLAELPDDFHEGVGGGWAFQNACIDRNGTQWTGMHKVMDELIILGIATKLVDFSLPREMWAVFAGVGGLPYFFVKKEVRGQ